MQFEYSTGSPERKDETIMAFPVNEWPFSLKRINSISKKLQFSWNSPSWPTKFKLQVFDAVIRFKLIYSLESLELPSGTLCNLNVFQLKRLGRILKLRMTYVRRTCEHEQFFEPANAIVNLNNATGKHIKPVSEYI